MFITITQEPDGKEINKLKDEFHKADKIFEVWEFKNLTITNNIVSYENKPLTDYNIEGVIWRVTEGQFFEYENIHYQISKTCRLK